VQKAITRHKSANTFKPLHFASKIELKRITLLTKSFFEDIIIGKGSALAYKFEPTNKRRNENEEVFC
jgi:hypothetical protein